MARDRILRRVEVQLQYHASFLFWNLKGVLAERWAHGPHFNAVTDLGNQIQLTADGDPAVPVSPAMKLAVGGIAMSVLAWELPPSWSEAETLALEWLRDCLTALDPKTVVRVMARQQWIVPLKDVARVQRALNEHYRGLAEDVPEEYGTPYTGATLNAMRRLPNSQRLLTCQLGIIRPGMARAMFTSTAPEDAQPLLGAFVDVTETNENGLQNTRRLLEDVCAAVDHDAQHILARTVPKLLSHA